MTRDLSLNRLRHLARRVREVPFSFLIDQTRLLVRRYTWWPRCLIGRFRASARGGAPFSETFLQVGADLRHSVNAAVMTDAAYGRDLVARTQWVLDDRQVPCLGYGRLPLPTGAAWRSDSTTGFEWPLRYFPFVNFLTHGRLADVKVPWELSRLQSLVWLGEAALAHPDTEQRRRAGTALATTLDEWRGSNPLGYGPNWTVSMEVAIRAINIGLAASLGWEALGPASRDTIRITLVEHLEYLRRFPERSDHSGNHRLVTVCGLVFLEELVFGPVPHHDTRRQVWFDDIAEQFESDGLHVEHAPMYHRLCVETVLWTMACLARTGSEVPAELGAIVGRCCMALRALEMASGDLPVMGDSDSGQLVSFGGPTRSLRYLRQLLGFTAGGPPLLAALAGKTTLLRGAECLRGPTPPGAASPVHAERVGPFVRLGRENVDVTVRAGPHGLHGRASHDHDDNGSPWVTLGAGDLLVEGGCYAYTRSHAERLLDLSSERHNLVTVGGRSRFVLTPGSISPTVALAPIAVANTAGALVDATVHLTLRWTDPIAGSVRHARHIGLGPDGATVLVVDDEIAFDTPASATVRWHFAPQWSLTLSGGSTALAHNPVGEHLLVEILCLDARTPAALRIGEYRYAGRYGEVQRAPVLEADAAPAIAIRFRSAFRTWTGPK